MTSRDPIDDPRTASIIGAFHDVYNELGYGFLESVYSAAMAVELRARGHRVEREVLVDVYYKGERIARQRLDMLVDASVIVENKATATLPAITKPQLHSYLHGTGYAVGLVLHFGPEPTTYRVVCAPSTAPMTVMHRREPTSG